MSTLTLLGLAIGLGMDAFAVAIAAGAAFNRLTYRRLFRLSWHFGLFQALMPVLGWLLGSTVADYVQQFDHWVAFGLLALIGGKMIRESFDAPEQNRRGDPTRGWTLVLLSIATSIDALAVGLSLAFLQIGVVYASLVIGLVALGMTAAGMYFGRALGTALGKRMELVGGLVLVGIGLKILLEYLLS